VTWRPPPTPPFTPFAGERVAVVGLGRAGLPAARRLALWGAEVSVWDDGAEARTAAEAGGPRRSPIPPRPGRFRWDALLLSPGIPHRPAARAPGRRSARTRRRAVLCDVDWLYRAVRAAGSRARFAGVTGTNGKSTTTALLHHLLRAAGRGSAAGGNLGPAALSLDLLGDGGTYVLEMSSYMLERTMSVRFDSAAMLNLSPDHLDRHGDMDGYAAAKAGIFARQRPDDLAVLGMDDERTRAMRGAIVSRVRPISGCAPQAGGVWAEAGVLRDEAGPILDLAEAHALPGSHNAQNAAAAAACALDMGLTRPQVAAGLASFPGLPHRQEKWASSAALPSSTTARPPTPTARPARSPATTGWCGSPAAWRRRAGSRASHRSSRASPAPS
jgi:UDP-N-acetylmuramoylalanine--D-glutamate ligase